MDVQVLCEHRDAHECKLAHDDQGLPPGAPVPIIAHWNKGREGMRNGQKKRESGEKDKRRERERENEMREGERKKGRTKCASEYGPNSTTMLHPPMRKLMWRALEVSTDRCSTCGWLCCVVLY